MSWGLHAKSSNVFTFGNGCGLKIFNGRELQNVALL
jgi:hypothetical protein